MVCINCSEETIVINSRAQKKLNQIWRRRKCVVCSSIFTTIENVRLENSYLVSYGGGKLKSFSRDKLFTSILQSLQHRHEPIGDATELTHTIIAKLSKETLNGMITNQNIAQTTLVTLTRFDKAASVHYQAIHHLK